MTEMTVHFLDKMGSDLDVANAARVSFDKESELETYTWTERDSFLGYEHTFEGQRLSERDAKLIAYLAREGHWSPFSHCYAKFRIKAPIFVARQLGKHQVGLAWNEVSRRYVDTPPEFFSPYVWRSRADNVKQGSSDDRVYSYPTTYKERVVTTIPEAEYDTHLWFAVKTYNEMIAGGVCPEQARMVLPQSMMTEWIWSGSLYAFARVCKQRLDGHAQQETQQIAQGISSHMQREFPVSWASLTTPN